MGFDAFVLSESEMDEWHRQWVLVGIFTFWPFNGWRTLITYAVMEMVRMLGKILCA